MDGKLIVKANGLYLLSYHLDLIVIAALTADREPLLDFYAIIGFLFLKRARNHATVLEHKLLLIVAIYHFVC